jgi:ssDNA thymidine ADP-ribosyltransferase, DarT
MPKNEPEIGNLYYITHIENVQSIMTHRILAHAAIEERGIDYVPVYDAGIVADRQSRATSSGRSLWDYANLYFQPRNQCSIGYCMKRAPPTSQSLRFKNES